jgi:hypothetical protein
MYLQSTKSVKHNAAKSVNRSIFIEKPIYRVRCLYSSFVHAILCTVSEYRRFGIYSMNKTRGRMTLYITSAMAAS